MPGRPANPDHEQARGRAYTADDAQPGPRIADKARPAPATGRDPGDMPVSVELDAGPAPRRGPQQAPNLVSDRHAGRRQSPLTILAAFLVLLAAAGLLVWLAG